jgi:hypothetical protein
MCHETYYRKDNKSCKHTGTTINKRNNHSISETKVKRERFNRPTNQTSLCTCITPKVIIEIQSTNQSNVIMYIYHTKGNHRDSIDQPIKRHY